MFKGTWHDTHVEIFKGAHVLQSNGSRRVSLGCQVETSITEHHHWSKYQDERYSIFSKIKNKINKIKDINVKSLCYIFGNCRIPKQLTIVVMVESPTEESHWNTPNKTQNSRKKITKYFSSESVEKQQMVYSLTLLNSQRIRGRRD